jgi:hypothetical protein
MKFQKDCWKTPKPSQKNKRKERKKERKKEKKKANVGWS